MLSIFLIYAVLFLSWFIMLCATRSPEAKWGVIWQPGAWWIGVHYSPFCKRYCVNIVPWLTLWVAEPDGKIPYSTR